MLYTMVCRIDEILSIKVGNLIFDSVKPHVMAIGKGRKSRTVYIMSRTVSILKEHILMEHSKTPNPDASLFFSHSKGLFSKVSMTNNIVQKNRYHGSTHCQACLETIRETQRHLLNKEIGTYQITMHLISRRCSISYHLLPVLIIIRIMFKPRRTGMTVIQGTAPGDNLPGAGG